LRDEAFAYCAFFSLPVPNIPEVPEVDSEALSVIRKWETKRAAEKAEETKRQRAEALVRQQELITKWRAGEYHGCLYDIPPMLRIAGNEVETSLGARFPIAQRRGCHDGVWVRGKSFCTSLNPYILMKVNSPGLKIAMPAPVTWAAFMIRLTVDSICEGEILLPSSRLTGNFCANRATEPKAAIAMKEKTCGRNRFCTIIQIDTTPSSKSSTDRIMCARSARV
jgi:hypothetical protein